jgi:hypothetical protein
MLLLCHGSLMVCSIHVMRGSGRVLAGIPQSWGMTEGTHGILGLNLRKIHEWSQPQQPKQ